MGKPKPQAAKGDEGISSIHLWIPLTLHFLEDTDLLATNLVQSYLHKQNRPYSVTDIMNNMHNAFPKSTIQKALQQLVDAGTVSCKSQGGALVVSFRWTDIREAQHLRDPSGKSKIHVSECRMGRMLQLKKNWHSWIRRLNRLRPKSQMPKSNSNTSHQVHSL